MSYLSDVKSKQKDNKDFQKGYDKAKKDIVKLTQNNVEKMEEETKNITEYGEIRLSLLKNPMLVFNNTIGAGEQDIDTPILYKDYVIGVVSNVTEESICCRIWDKFIRFYPEYNSKDKAEKIRLFDINVLLPMDEINRQNETETYVAVEMYKQFMKDNMAECAKVRKQILKKQEVNYFKNKSTDRLMDIVDNMDQSENDYNTLQNVKQEIEKHVE